jgi:hypothetical protein
MTILPGTPSDEIPQILATGRSDIGLIYLSMSARDPAGRDAGYLQWHSLDHRPEQHRLKTLRASFRLVSTPACRASRAVSDQRFDATDHVMTYLFTDLSALPAFNELSVALAQAGRVQHRLPLVERSVYRLDGSVAAPRIKAGADVLPWWPARGAYLLIERGQTSSAQLMEVPGVGGVLWGGALPLDQQRSAGHLLPSRRRSRSDCGTATTRVGATVGPCGRRAASRSTVSFIGAV